MQYQSIHLLVYLGIASLSYALMSNANDIAAILASFVGSENGYQQHLIWIVGLVIVSLVTALLNYSRVISNIIVEHLPFSRFLRRLIAGRHFIEGDWPLIVVQGEGSPDAGKLLYYGYLTIDYKDDQLRVFGEDWTPEHKSAHKFASVKSNFISDHRERRLEYFYWQGASKNRHDMRGYTEIHFFPTHKLSEVHTGEFRDINHHNVRFYARKIRYKFREKRLRTPSQQRKAAEDIWLDLQPRIHTVIGQDVTVDFR